MDPEPSKPNAEKNVGKIQIGGPVKRIRFFFVIFDNKASTYLNPNSTNSLDPGAGFNEH